MICSSCAGGDIETVTRQLKELYGESIQTWLNREKERWCVADHFAPDYTLETLMGEPVVRIKHGDRFVIAPWTNWTNCKTASYRCLAAFISLKPVCC